MYEINQISAGSRDAQLEEEVFPDGGGEEGQVE
jgi:hypothetical protein